MSFFELLMLLVLIFSFVDTILLLHIYLNYGGNESG